MFFVFSLTNVGDFTLTKNETYGDYHNNFSQKSTHHSRAAVKTYEKTGVSNFVDLFKTKTDGEFNLVQKINFKREKFDYLLVAGKSFLQPPGANNNSRKPRKNKED